MIDSITDTVDTAIVTVTNTPYVNVRIHEHTFHTFVHLFTHLSTHSFLYLFVYLCCYLFIHFKKKTTKDNAITDSLSCLLYNGLRADGRRFVDRESVI